MTLRANRIFLYFCRVARIQRTHNSSLDLGTVGTDVTPNCTVPLKREQKVTDVCQTRLFSPSVERYPSVATTLYRTINLYDCQPRYP
jgi:hypothetical protein